jgi:hypothetical protein
MFPEILARRLMVRHPHLRILALGIFVCSIAVLSLFAQSTVTKVREVAPDNDWPLWVFANISYAAMRAQNNPSAGWRIVSFIFGFPGTLLSYFIVDEGGERMYGFDVPRRRV